MSLLDDVSLMITPNGIAENVLFGVLPQPIIGAEKVTDGDFPTGTSAWTTAAGWAIANGAATCSSGNDNLSQDVSAVAGKTYKITLDVTLTITATLTTTTLNLNHNYRYKTTMWKYAGTTLWPGLHTTAS